ncbi:MAG: DNA polymerase III subunit beta [Oscillospiraceae bacterium]|jgi:DNA polymerase-3 subunit beta
MISFTCEKAALASAVGIASRTVSPKSTIPALEGILIEAGAMLRLTGYDLETGIKTSIPANITEMGAIVLPARIFGDIVRRMPDDIISFRAKDDLSVTIESGMSRFDLVGIEAQNFPAMPDVDEMNAVTIGQNTIKSMIADTLFAVSSDDTRPILTGELFDIEDNILTLVAVDGYRLAIRREAVLENEYGNISFVVPSRALSEVEKLCSEEGEDALITVGSKHIAFGIGPTTLVSRRLEGEFLNYKKSVLRDGPIFIECDRRALLGAFERVSIVITDREKIKTAVRCKFDLGEVKLSANTALGSAIDVCSIDGDGGGLEIGFNNRFMLEALRAIRDDRVRLELKSELSPCVIAPAKGGNGEDPIEEHFTHMVLPVRLR